MDLDFLVQNWYLILSLIIILAMLLLEPYLLKLSGINSVGPLGVTQLVNHKSAAVLDVCTSNEFNNAHIPDAINVPLSEISGQQENIKRYKEKPVIISCRSGSRAKSAAKKLSKLGYKELYILTGGNTAWEKENLPMTRKAG